MNIDFSICPKNNIPTHTQLQVIFRVWGNTSYCVPSKKIDPHKYYLVITTRGNGCLRADDSTYFLSSNTILLIQPTSFLSYKCADNIWEFWWFEFNHLPSLLPLFQVIPSTLTSFQLSILEHSLRYAKEDNWLIAESLFCSVFQIIALGENRRVAPAATVLLESIEQYILTNYKTLHVNDLSEIFLISNRSLYNLFKQQKQCSPKQYIDRIRLENAKQLLLNSSLSIQEISEQLAYKNQFHFSKRFTQYCGVSPLNFRNASQ